MSLAIFNFIEHLEAFKTKTNILWNPDASRQLFSLNI